MPTLATTNFNIVVATLGGFVTLFGLVSYLLKEHYYLSEPCKLPTICHVPRHFSSLTASVISLFGGIIFSPHAINWIRPLDYARGSEQDLESITLTFSRLVLDVQLVIAGIQLPSKYLRHQWKSLAILLGPGMVAMWVSSSLLVWAMVPHLSFLHALAVGACVTPTDPVLSNSILKGKFADKNIPKGLQNIIIAESGTNDGLGYPFLFFALYLIKYVTFGGAGQPGGARKAMGYWFGETWGYTILLGALYGVVVGWIAKELLHWAEEKKYVDRESFLVHAITLALFICGTCGMIGSDDVLASFIAGNVFNWDDWFRTESQDDSLQPTIDMLLNLSIFMWYGAVAPWASFGHSDIIPVYRLIFLGVLILLLRRVPFVYSVRSQLSQIEDSRQALTAGFFGPIGVSAIFYLYICVEFCNEVTVDGVVREDAARLADTTRVVVWFLCICSIIVHGLSVPFGKLGYHLPRTLSGKTISRESDPEEPEPPHPVRNYNRVVRAGRRLFRRERPSNDYVPQDNIPAPSFPLRGSVIPSDPTQSAAMPASTSDNVPPTMSQISPNTHNPDIPSSKYVHDEGDESWPASEATAVNNGSKL
ncbi:MAG: hypothetical protein Q9218_003495 [Villophora microphyllina]